MKKEVLSMMMALMLAFVGVARAQVALPYDYGFETTLADAGWTTSNGHNYTYRATGNAIHGGSYGMQFYDNSAVVQGNQYLISPEIDGTNGVSVSFWYKNYVSSNPWVFNVGYSTTNTDPNSFTWVEMANIPAPNTAWRQSEAFLCPAGTKYVAIRCNVQAFGGTYAYAYFFIDDITIANPVVKDLPYDYGFETPLASDGWMTQNRTANTLVATGAAPREGTYGLQFHNQVAGGQYLISPELNLNGADGVAVTFWYGIYNAAYPQAFQVGYSTTTPAVDQFTFGETITAENVTSPSDRNFLQLEPQVFPAETKYVAVKYTTGYYLFIDDFSFSPIVNPDIPEYVRGLHVTNLDGTVIDSVLVGPRPAGAWMEPFHFKMFNDTTHSITVSVLDFTPNSDYLSMAEGTELPMTLGFNDTVDLYIETTIGENVAAGDYPYEYVAIYEGSRLAKIWPLVLSVYTPEIPDVVEKPYELNDGQPLQSGFEYVGVPARITPTELHNDYTLPYSWIPEGVDGVYKMTIDQTVMLSARVSDGENGKVALYLQEGDELPHPMADNYYNSSAFEAHPDPVYSWFSHAYTGTNTWYGTSAGGGYYFGYRISADIISQLGIANASITSVETAAREAYPYDLYVMRGGTSPSNATLVHYQPMLTAPQPLYFFDLTLNTPVEVGNEDLWVFFYSESPYAAYCGRTPADPDNGKIWTMNPNASQPAWSSSTSYTPVINCELMQYPEGRRMTLDLANMRLEERGNGIFSEEGEAQGDVRGIARGERFNARNGMRNPVCGPEIDSLRVDAGTYYLVASSTDPDFEVTINVDEVPCPEPAVAIYPLDNQDSIQPSSVTLKWQLDPYATEWRLVFGSTYWPEPDHDFTVLYPADGSWSSDLSMNSYTVTNLFNNTNYFWRIEQRNNGETGCSNTGDVWGFTTHLNAPRNLQANDYTIFEGDSVTLSWNAIQDRTYRRYKIYKNGELIHATPITPYPNVNLTWTVPASEFEYNMTEGYNFNVTALYDEGESAFSNTINIKVSGTGNINGHVYEQDGSTGIAGATVTYEGIDEFGASHTYNFTTDANGYYSGSVYAGNYNGSATCAGYQPVDTPDEPYTNPVGVTYDQTTADVNYTLDEIFCPPLTVCADFVEINGEELVKVWWTPCDYDALLERDGDRSLNHYRIYRTDCYNDGPFDSINTVLLSTVWVPDTAYIDVSWPDAAPGVYKWGVGAVYAGNRESVVRWADSPRSGDEDLPEEGEFVEEISGMRAPWDLLHSFQTSTNQQYGVASDGNFIYTSAWSTGAGNHFYKYDLEGNLIEAFDIDGVGYLRDMTYDGQYFYGSDNSSRLYCLDLANHTLIETINTQMTQIRHCSYDPVNDGFWVGNWGDLYRITRAGTVVFQGPVLTQCSGSAYYTAEDGSAHLYLFRNINNSYGYVYDYDIDNNSLGTDYIFDFTATPGYTGTSTCGGAFIGEYNGKVAFFGDMQTSPNLVGIYELHDMPEPPAPVLSDNNLLALPRESVTVWSTSCGPCLDKDMYIPSVGGDRPVSVNVVLNSNDSPDGTTVSFTNLNEYEEQQFGIQPLTLDGSGFYQFDSFRRGSYAVEVYHEGFYTIFDTVNIGVEPDPQFELRYVMTEILYPVRDLYVSSTGAALWGLESGWEGVGPSDVPTPEPGEPSVLFEDDFENGFGSWTVVDADGDGDNWECIYSPYTSAHSGAMVAASHSWYIGTFYDPDQWLISPLVEGATSIRYYMSVNTVFTDHYGVFVSSTGINPSDFTLVFDETPSFSKDGGKALAESGRDGRPQSDWMERTVNLPAGTKYVAFRHYDSYDGNSLLIDDVTIYGGGTRATAQNRHLQYYKVMCTSIDGEPIFSTNTERTLCILDTENLVEGETYICKVAAMFSTGLSPWTEQPWVYVPCENFDGTQNGVNFNGSSITWTYPGVTPTPDPDPEPSQTLFSDNFESGTLSNWTLVDADGDGNNWIHVNVTNYTNWSVPPTAHSGVGLASSWSHSGGQLYPDNYMITPLVDGATQVKYFVSTNAGYEDYYEVMASTTGNAVADFAVVFSETAPTAKAGTNGGRASMEYGNGRAQGPWFERNIDLPEGTKYVAFRHIDTNQNYLFIDDVTVIGSRDRDDVLFDQAQFVTDPGVINGADASWLQGTQTSLGPNIVNPNYIIGDEFTLAQPSLVTGLTVYSYQTGSTTTSTFTGFYAQIYDGNPMTGGQPVWGNLSTNIMTHTEWTGAYRGAYGSFDTTRPIMSITAEGLDIILEPGTYYLVWNLRGSLSSGPWGVPVTISNILNTGDAIQYANGAWNYYVDGGSNQPVGMAFKVMGTNAPIEGIVGAAIFKDGELIDIVPSNINSYPADGENYCVSIIYDGEMNGEYFSMSCLECANGDGGATNVEENSADVAIFPNPTNGNVKIVANGMRHITVVSTLGQVVYDADLSADEASLNMAQWNAGVYVVRIVTESGISAQRVTVVR